MLNPFFFLLILTSIQARDLPKIVQAGYHLIPYFIFSPQEGESSYASTSVSKS